jgi:hypothetical protein
MLQPDFNISKRYFSDLIGAAYKKINGSRLPPLIFDGPGWQRSYALGGAIAGNPTRVPMLYFQAEGWDT